MPAKKITELPAASTLTGTEEIPVVQGGATKRATSAAIVEAERLRAVAAEQLVESSAVTIAGDQVVSGPKTFSKGLTVTDKIFADDFERSNRTLHGDVAPTGQTWSQAGPGTASIASGNYVNNNNNTYLGAQLEASPFRIGGKCAFTASGGGTDVRAALILAFTNAMVDMVHLNFHSGGGRVSLWTSAASQPPAWAANTAYATDFVVLQSGNRYSAIKDFTSTATFDSTNWSLLGANVASDSPMLSGEPSAAITFASPLTAGVEYEVQMTIDGGRVLVMFMQGETVIGIIDCFDPRVNALQGTFPIWQIQGNLTTPIVTWRWTSVSAVRARNLVVDGDAVAGAFTGSVGSRQRHSVYASVLGVGLSSPICPLDVLQTVALKRVARFRAKNTAALVVIESEGAGTATELRFAIGGSTDTSAARIRSNGSAYDLDFQINSVSRLKLPFGGGTIDLGGIPKQTVTSNLTTTAPVGASKWFKWQDSAGATYWVEGKLA